MFNIFFDKKQINFGHKNLEEYTPTSLPKNTESGHVDLSTFIVGDYSLLNDSFIDNIYILNLKKKYLHLYRLVTNIQMLK